MTQRRLLLLSQTVAVAALLAACGGGSDAPAPVPAPQPGPLEQVPGSASQSAAGMTGYLKTLSTLAPEDKEPLDLGSFTAPAVDNAEPDPVS
jgi:hypothetical protein